MLGGLISERGSRGNAGIPFLKDIPVVLGNCSAPRPAAARATELIVLITPYVVNDDHDARSVTEAFRGMLGAWAATCLRPAAGQEVPSSRRPAAPEPYRATGGRRRRRQHATRSAARWRQAERSRERGGDANVDPRLRTAAASG